MVKMVVRVRKGVINGRPMDPDAKHLHKFNIIQLHATLSDIWIFSPLYAVYIAIRMSDRTNTASLFQFLT